MSEKQESKAIVKHQNFDEIVASLADFSERASEKHTALEKVKPHRKLLGKSKTPTIDDINNVVDGIDDQLISLKDFNVEVLNVLTGVVVALSALDKEHISGILISANLAKEASEQAVNNVKSISAIITILKSQKHLRDIDQSWEDLKKQRELIWALFEYKEELLKLKHLTDVDKLWDNSSSQSKSIEGLEKKIIEITKVLEAQGKSISDLGSTVRDIGEKQQAFIEAANKHLAERQAAVDKQLEEREKALQETLSSLNEQVKREQENLIKKAEDLSKAQTDTLSAIGEAQVEKLQQLENAQTERLAAVQKEQSEALMRIEIAQAETLKSIEKGQAERLDKMAAAQADTLAKLNHEQVEKMQAINKSLEEEKATLNETVSSLAQKVKIAYIVAGGTVTITVIHLLLNILGVL